MTLNLIETRNKSADPAPWKVTTKRVGGFVIPDRVVCTATGKTIYKTNLGAPEDYANDELWQAELQHQLQHTEYIAKSRAYVPVLLSALMKACGNDRVLANELVAHSYKEFLQDLGLHPEENVFHIE